MIHLAPFEQLLGTRNGWTRFGYSGRVFVLAAFAAPALLLALTLRELAPPIVVLAGLAIYLFCPASIMFSQVIKPHWYALIWANAACC